MNASNIATIYLKELKDTLRDRRTLMSTIVIPTLVMPLLMFGTARVATAVVNKAKEEVPIVAVVGGEDSPAVVKELTSSSKFRLVPLPADWRAQISDKKLRAAVLVPPGFATGLKAARAEPVVVYNYKGELKSEIAAGALDDFFRGLRDRAVAADLAARSLPPTLARPFDIQRENVAPPEKVGGNLFGGILPYLIIVLCFSGAMYPALDLTAGEKERGTMETLLCSPVARVDIVLGKFLMVLTGSLSAMLMSLTSLGVTAATLGLLGSGTARAAVAAAKSGENAFAFSIDPLGLLGVLALILPVAVLFSAVLFTVALFAKSYKEAQSYAAPMVVVVILPGIVGMLPGIDLNARLALVPILNLSLVCKEMLSGVWHWHYIALIFGSSCVYAGAALALAVRMFSRESVMFRV